MDVPHTPEKTKQLLSYIEQTELKSGGLGQLFCGGTIAAILSNDDRVERLFQSILEWLGLAGSGRTGNHSRFGHLLDLARNHSAGNATAGDMLTFQPGFVVNLSRKFLVYESTVNRSLQAFPRFIRFPIPRSVVLAISFQTLVVGGRDSPIRSRNTGTRPVACSIRGSFGSYMRWRLWSQQFKD